MVMGSVRIKSSPIYHLSHKDVAACPQITRVCIDFIHYIFLYAQSSFYDIAVHSRREAA